MIKTYKIKQSFKIENWLFWTALLLFFTIIHFAINLDFFGLTWDNMLMLEGDAEQYVGSVENLIKNGEYTFSKTNEHLFFSNLLDQKFYDKGIYYAFRTPGFAILYYPIRLIFNFQNSLMIIIFVQIILNALTKYLLCRLLFSVTKNKISFYFGILFFIFSIYASFFNSFLMTESLAIFFLVTSLYLLHTGLNSANKWTFFWVGICLTEAMLLRPFLAPLFLPFVILIYLRFKNGISKSLIFLFLLPLILFESFWLPRNYFKSGEFIPLSKTMEIFNYSNKAFLLHQKITQNIGVSGEWWNKKSPSYWFSLKKDLRPVLTVYPKKLFTTLNDTNNILRAKKEYLLSKNLFIKLESRIKHEKKSFYILSKINNKYTTINPYYSISSRFRIAYEMLLQPLQKPLISIKYPFNVLSIILESFINRFAFVFGLFASIFALFRFRKNKYFILLALIPILLFVLFTIITMQLEYREMYISYYLFSFFGIELTCYFIINRKYYLFAFSSILLLTFVYWDMINNIKF